MTPIILRVAKMIDNDYVDRLRLEQVKRVVFHIFLSLLYFHMFCIFVSKSFTAQTFELLNALKH